jgi:hypothetical protein
MPGLSGAAVIDDRNGLGAERRPWSWTISAGGAAVVVAVLLTTGSPTASAQTGLADWLSRAAGHVEDIHKAENASYDVTQRGQDGWLIALASPCMDLRDANEALRGVMPAPDPQVTAEVQAAIDNFDSAWQACNTAVHTLNPNDLNYFTLYLQTAEQHFSGADTVLVGLARAG